MIKSQRKNILAPIKQNKLKKPECKLLSDEHQLTPLNNQTINECDQIENLQLTGENDQFMSSVIHKLMTMQDACKTARQSSRNAVDPSNTDSFSLFKNYTQPMKTQMCSINLCGTYEEINNKSIEIRWSCIDKDCEEQNINKKTTIDDILFMFND